MAFGRMGARGGFGSFGVLGKAGTSGPLAFAYYVAANGSDSNPGTQSQPWQTLAKVTAQSFSPNTTVSFRGGDTFAGTLTLPSVSGTAGQPIKYTSYGTGQATIAPAASTDGIYGNDLSYITVDSLTVTGSLGTTGIGIHLESTTTVSTNLTVQNCTVTNMAWWGILLFANSGASAGLTNPTVKNCTATGNSSTFNGTSGGIRISGSNGGQNTHYSVTGALIDSCIASNNPGAAGTSSWCGSGIFMSQINGGTIQNCLADGNGANCNATAGPTGIWLNSCTGVTIQKNISRNTKTSAADGGGFDLDGGCDHCTVQFNVSQSNAGFGYLVYEYDDATFSSNNNNVIRNNISWNDLGGAVRLVSGGTHDNTGQCYNNYFKTVNTASRTIRLEKLGGALNWQISNNNIESSKSGTTNLVETSGNPSGCIFTGNNYFTPNTLAIVWNGTTYTSIALWRAGVPTQETIASTDTSKNVAPLNMGFATTTRGTVPFSLAIAAEPLRPDEASPLMNAGVDLFANYSINPGTSDFYGSAISTAGPWSIGHAAMKSALKSVILNTTGTGNWTVPASFSKLFRVDTIAAGGSGNATAAGGGGAAYAGSDLAALWPSWVAGTTTVPYLVGAASAGANGQESVFGASTLAAAIALGATLAVGADPGKTNSGSTGGLGGLAVNSVGVTTYNGGNAGTSGTGFHSGGGGAAGPFGPGAIGGNGMAAGTGSGGGGGGGANGGTAGVAAVNASGIGGTGGGGPYSSGPAGTATNGTAGAQGTGGSGAGNSSGIGGAGGPGVDWRDSTSGLFFGAGAGAGASVANGTTTNTGGAFGGGGPGRSGALGGQGGIRILYKTVASL